MALNWQWKDKCGEATFSRCLPDREPEEFTVNLYEGNAFLIFIYEYEENGTNMYNLYSFFTDEAHAKRCLGLDKEYGSGNIFDDTYNRLLKVRLNKEKLRKGDFKKLVTLFTQAFDEITIELYKED